MKKTAPGPHFFTSTDIHQPGTVQSTPMIHFHDHSKMNTMIFQAAMSEQAQPVHLPAAPERGAVGLFSPRA